MFTGQYNHTMDAKGRVSMPARFREKLGATLIVTKGYINEKCLYMFWEEAWAEYQTKLNCIPSSNVLAKKFARYVVGSSSYCDIDKQGRIIVPQYLRDFAELGSDVVISGLGNRFELWDRARWEEELEFDPIEAMAIQKEIAELRL